MAERYEQRWPGCDFAMQIFTRWKMPRPYMGSKWSGLSRPKLFFPPARFEARLEEQYLTFHGEHYNSYRRNAVVFSLVSWLIFIGWDVFYAATDPNYFNSAGAVFTIRAFGIVVLVHFIVKSRERSFHNEGHATREIALHAGAIYVLLLTMFCIVPVPYAFVHFYSGLSLMLVYVYGLSRMLSRPTILMSVVYGLATWLVMRVRSDLFGDNALLAITGMYVWVSACYLAIVILCGIAVVTELEKTSRSVFLRELELDRSKAEEHLRNLQLSALNQELVSAQSDLENKTNALIKSMDERRRLAEQGNREKSYFISCAIHDVRQPATAMLSLIHPIEKALAEGELDKAAIFLSKMARAGTVMNASFSNVLDLSRIESGLTTPNYENFKLDQALRSAIESMRLAAESSGVWIKYIPSRHEEVMVRSDYSFLHRVLCNLIGNGIKYCDMNKSPKVVVGAVYLHHSIRIDVVDNGIGIDERYWGDIFKPFFQINNQRNDTAKGLGLGLSLVNGMVSRLREHSIEFRSVEHRGSRFSVHVPLAAPGLQLRAEDALRDPCNEDLPTLYVLLLEEDEIARESLVECLNSYNARVESTSSLQEMTALLNSLETAPDFVMLDTGLLNADADLNPIREKGRAFGVEIPMLFMLEGRQKPAWMGRAGPAISKPFLSQELVQHIRNARSALMNAQASEQ